MTRTLVRLAVPVGFYALLEWLFAYATQAEGLLSPGGIPHVPVVALGGVFLAMRLLVRWVVPWFAVFALVSAWLTRRPSRSGPSAGTGPASSPSSA